MGQIIGGAAKPKRCNLNNLSQWGTPAAGEHILVSSDNSMNAAGQGNFDCYIVGDGNTAAAALPLIKTYANDADDEPTSGSDKLVKSEGVASSYGYYKSQTKSATQGSNYTNYFTNIKIKTGQKFRVKATGTLIGTNPILNLYVNSPSGTSLGNVTINGAEVVITAAEDITTLACYRYSGNVTVSGSVTVEVLIEGSVINKQIDGIKADITNLTQAVNSLEPKIDGQDFNGSNNSAGSKIFSVPFVYGESYVLTNTSASGTINLFTNDGTNDVQTIKTNLEVNGSVEFIPSVDAPKLRVYFNGSSGGSFACRRKSIDDKIGEVTNAIDTTNANIANLSLDVHGASLIGSRTSNGSNYYDFPFRVGNTITLKNTSESGSINAFTYDGTNDVQTIKTQLEAGKSVVFTPSMAASKLRVYFNGTSGGSFEIKTESVDEEIDVIKKTIYDVNTPLSFTENTDKYYDSKNIGTNITSESQLLVTGSGKYKAIDLSDYQGKKLKFRISRSGSSQSGRGTMLVSNDFVVYSAREVDILNQDIVLDIPSNSILYESHATDSTISVYIVEEGYGERISTLEENQSIFQNQLNECFVATDGSDENVGSEISPFATIAHAISIGYKNICVKAGEYYEIINLQGKNGVNIYANDKDTYDSGKRKRPIFLNGKAYDSFEEGGEYKYFIPEVVPLTYTNVFVNHTTQPIEQYQGFANTYNAGLWAKCSNKFNDFMFKPVLTLEELSENNTFYFDGTNIYFNTDVNIEGVIVVYGNYHVFKASACNNLHISGICFDYGYNDTVLIEKCNNVLFENCEFGHSLRRNNVDYSQSDLRLTNCESYKAKRDGFNAAYYGISFLENCNSRYNYDDGESSHEYCEVEISGGEYSYNGKAGHAPVNGCKFKCNGTYSHHNLQFGLLRPGAGNYDVEPYLISNSVFVENGTSDIETYIELNLMNCKYVTKTGTGTINDLTQ